MTSTSTAPVSESRQLAASTPDHRLSIVLLDHSHRRRFTHVRNRRSVLAPKGGEGTEMSIIHTVTALLARKLLTRHDEQPSSTTGARLNTQNRTDADQHPEHARNR